LGIFINFYVKQTKEMIRISQNLNEIMKILKASSYFDHSAYRKLREHLFKDLAISLLPEQIILKIQHETSKGMNNLECQKI
jgi:hypothetical protein